MTNVEFVKYVANKSGLTQKVIRDVLTAVEDGLSDKLMAGESVKVIDTVFGVKDVEDRECRNPATGETFIKPAHKAVTVKASQTLKNIVK